MTNRLVKFWKDLYQDSMDVLEDIGRRSMEGEPERCHSLSIDEMLNLTEQVKDWRATIIYRHPEKEYSHIGPTVREFQGKIGNITLELESSAQDSFSQWYRLTASSSLNNLGNYKEKERKCPPRLVEFFSSLESRYVQNYFERLKSDMKNGLDEAKRLIVNK